MTEYWKSQGRKYCEFCKCWIADNKVSVSFHENGKRHKEAVAKHISQVTKRSAKDFKQKEKMDDEIKKMEAAAMAAYLKDVENNVDADLTSQTLNQMLNDAGGSAQGDTKAPAPIVQASKKPVWHEVKSDDGNYFWNIENNETTWDPPDEYLSLAQQEEQKIKEEEKTKKQAKIDVKLKKQKHKESMKEVKAHLSRESMRSRAAPPEPAPAAAVCGPAPAARPYGTWTTVVTEPVEAVDLQLPKSQRPKPPPPVVVEPDERLQFKERTVESLGDGPVEFKKRKLGHNRKNMRQKLDTDD
ncbi:WW domain-binding protein 4 [Plutella xylostella]|uniref:WW domain-binding protein 4 n=1 Tax=Plutella xylostella TaxID=51655 RepID=UPI0020328C54|nr:WW domain-binding protein 4 [Plutella xylostella]